MLPKKKLQTHTLKQCRPRSSTARPTCPRRRCRTTTPRRHRRNRSKGITIHPPIPSTSPRWHLPTLSSLQPSRPLLECNFQPQQTSSTPTLQSHTVPHATNSDPNATHRLPPSPPILLHMELAHHQGSAGPQQLTNQHNLRPLNTPPTPTLPPYRTQHLTTPTQRASYHPPPSPFLPPPRLAHHKGAQHTSSNFTPCHHPPPPSPPQPSTPSTMASNTSTPLPSPHDLRCPTPAPPTLLHLEHAHHKVPCAPLATSQHHRRQPPTAIKHSSSPNPPPHPSAAPSSPP